LKKRPEHPWKISVVFQIFLTDEHMEVRGAKKSRLKEHSTKVKIKELTRKKVSNSNS